MRVGFYEKLRKVYYYKNKYTPGSDTSILLQLLTMEEAKVFMLLCEGFTIQECAKRLNRRRSDVRNTKKGIFKKLEVDSITGLIVKYGEANKKV
ncbi:MAG TPA: hypothetical protein DDZ89_14855 [Clostridiales bacterium]|nr:hypothetical protein [Clostridiales bacterium]